MAVTTRKWKPAGESGSWVQLAAKIVVAATACLVVQILWAQAPPAGEGAAREEIDAQGFKYQVPNEKWMGAKGRSEEMKNRQGVRTVLSGQYPINDPATKLKFREYFQRYLFPVMTTEEGFKTIVKDRQDFFRDLERARSPDAHREIIDLTLASMMKIVTDNYRPAARYNAMLIISNLNDQEPGNLGTSQTLPEPMQRALPFIVQQFKKADSPDSIKLAALLGLARHLEWDNYKEPPSTPMPAAERADIIREITKLVEAKQPPQGRDPEAHKWMRRRAVEALSMASLKKSDAGIVATFDKLLNDETDDLSVRFTVASVLGKISLQPPAKIDAVAAAKELGYMALLGCDAELNRAENYRKTELEREARLTGTYSPELGYGTGDGAGMPGMGGPGGGMRPGGYGDSGGVRPRRPTPGIGGTEGGYGDASATGYADPSMMDPKHYRLEYVRRRMRQQLYAVQLGLTGGDDHPPPKTSGGTSLTSATSPTATGGSDKKELKGVFAVAKNQAEKDDVDKVYHKVRKLIEAVEAASDIDINQLVKEVRKEMTGLEQITKRLPPPGAATAAAPPLADDTPGAAPKKGKTAPAKAPLPVKGKSASAPRRPVQGVFGMPRSR